MGQRKLIPYAGKDPRDGPRVRNTGLTMYERKRINNLYGMGHPMESIAMRTCVPIEKVRAYIAQQEAM